MFNPKIKLKFLGKCIKKKLSKILSPSASCCWWSIWLILIFYCKASIRVLCWQYTDKPMCPPNPTEALYYLYRKQSVEECCNTNTALFPPGCLPLRRQDGSLSGSVNVSGSRVQKGRCTSYLWHEFFLPGCLLSDGCDQTHQEEQQ